MKEKQLLELVELIIGWLARIPIKPILLSFSLLGLGIGIFLIIRPAFAIEIQRRFYEKINWKIEPISMPREIRNTKLMGLFLVIVAFLTLTYISQR